MNPLKAGDIAPKFSLPDQDGEQVNLTDFQGQRVLVYFYPKAMTPGCTVQACGLRDNMDELKKAGVDVLGIQITVIRSMYFLGDGICSKQTVTRSVTIKSISR